jgi:hypothetical protein
MAKFQPILYKELCEILESIQMAKFQPILYKELCAQTAMRDWAALILIIAANILSIWRIFEIVYSHQIQNQHVLSTLHLF